jgi:hypothetical protein
MAHLPGKPYWPDDSQVVERTDSAGRIAAEDDRVGHRRTILVGDLNMAPIFSLLVFVARHA